MNESQQKGPAARPSLKPGQPPLALRVAAGFAGATLWTATQTAKAAELTVLLAGLPIAARRQNRELEDEERFVRTSPPRRYTTHYRVSAQNRT